MSGSQEGREPLLHFAFERPMLDDDRNGDDTIIAKRDDHTVNGNMVSGDEIDSIDLHHTVLSSLDIEPPWRLHQLPNNETTTTCSSLS